MVMLMIRTLDFFQFIKIALMMNRAYALAALIVLHRYVRMGIYAQLVSGPFINGIIFLIHINGCI